MSSISIKVVPYQLRFHNPAKTSRDTLFTKPSWFIRIADPTRNHEGWGECSLIPGLSVEEPGDIKASVKTLTSITDLSELERYCLTASPSLRFAIETAMLAFKSEHPFTLYETRFTRGEAGIPINGLIWMGDDDHVLNQMRARVDEGFTILKMKIGAREFDQERLLLERIRSEFPAEQFELRLDANGAFTADNALARLKTLEQFDIHSIEQPIKPGQFAELATLCAHSPIAIALDEELIGLKPNAALLEKVHPQFLIVKPSLLGGFKVAERWIELAEARGIGWWATSALESNIGLNAIAQWCASTKSSLPQGLGTGRLFTNNIEAPLVVREGHLFLDQGNWNLSCLHQ